jgi:dipeptidyl aminopeptidase/acylaminoacyl peptidase
MKQLLTILVAAVMLVLMVRSCATPVPTPAPATATAPIPHPASRTAFYSDRDGDTEISVVDADGTPVQQLTDNDDWDGEPSWSPDGKRIAFDSWRDVAQEIFVMDVYLTKAAATTKAEDRAAAAKDKAAAAKGKAATTKAEDGDDDDAKAAAAKDKAADAKGKAAAKDKAADAKGKAATTKA